MIRQQTNESVVEEVVDVGGLTRVYNPWWKGGLGDTPPPPPPPPPETVAILVYNVSKFTRIML